MSADGSCQNAVNEAIVARLLAGMIPGSANTVGYRHARQRLPQEMVSTLARQSGALLGEGSTAVEPIFGYLQDLGSISACPVYLIR